MTLATLRSTDLTVTVSDKGAELQSVVDAQGRDWLWDGDERWWKGRAPILFPMVGVPNGGGRFGGVLYPLPKHGFARDHVFALIAHADDAVTYRLEDSDASRAGYPFAFNLDVTHRLEGTTLTTTVVATNRGDEPMPAGFGFHPAVRWPLPGTGAASRTDHIIRFDAPEPEPLRLIAPDGLIAPGPRETPVRDTEIHLHDGLFDQDALVWDRPVSRGLYFGVPGQPGVRADWPGMPMLGIWTKPGGAGFLCIEPWHSHADEEGFIGEFADKPGVVTLDAGETQTYAMSLTFGVVF
jgi:galactose mutarotase-like enzyme